MPPQQPPNQGKVKVTFDQIQFREDGKVKAVIALIIGLVAVIFLFTEKQDHFVRYYSALAVVFFLVCILLYILFAILGLVSGSITAIGCGLVPSAYSIATIIAIVKAVQGQKWYIPTITDYAVKIMNAV